MKFFRKYCFPRLYWQLHFRDVSDSGGTLTFAGVLVELLLLCTYNWLKFNLTSDATSSCCHGHWMKGKGKRGSDCDLCTKTHKTMSSLLSSLCYRVSRWYRLGCGGHENQTMTVLWQHACQPCMLSSSARPSKSANHTCSDFRLNFRSS